MNRAQTTNMSSNIFKERKKDVLDEIFKIQLNDQVVVEQNKNFIYASQRDYNFDKDINNLIKQKESKLLGLKMHDGNTTFQSSEQNLQLKHNQSDLSYAKIKLQRKRKGFHQVKFSKQSYFKRYQTIEKFEIFIRKYQK